MSHIHDTPPPVGLDPAQSPREYAYRAAEHKPMWLDDLEDDASTFEATLTAVVLVVLVVVAGYFVAHILFV